MTAETKNFTTSKWKKLNVADAGPQGNLEIRHMKYCIPQTYGVTFNEYEGDIVCCVLDVFEGTLSQYSLRKISDHPDMFPDIFDTRIVDYYWIGEDYIVLMLFNFLDQAIHHIGFRVNHTEKALLHSEEEKSTSPLTFTDGSMLSNDDVQWKMPWLGGITPITIKGEEYVLISTMERLIVNKYRPHRKFTGREIMNLCTDVKESYLCGATPFAYGENLYFVLHQNEAHQAHSGEERRKLFTDRITSVNLSNLDLSQDELAISDDTVDFMYQPLTKLSKGDFYTTYEHELEQQEQFIIIREKKTENRSKKRPATKKRIFILDLLKNTVNEHKNGMKCDSYATLIPHGFLVFCSNSSVGGSTLEYKIETMRTSTTTSLLCIFLHKFLMSAQLPKPYRKLFF